MCFRGTYEKILTHSVLRWYKINKIAYYLDSIIPFHTDIGQYCCRYCFLVLFKSDIANFLQNRYNILVHCTALVKFFVVRSCPHFHTCFPYVCRYTDPATSRPARPCGGRRRGGRGSNSSTTTRETTQT